METWAEIIGSVGFPIAVAMALGYFIYLVWVKMIGISEKREERLYEIIAETRVNNDKLVEVNKEFVKVLETYKTDITEIKHDIEDIKDIIVKEN